MRHSFQVNDHCLAFSTRCNIEVIAITPELSVNVAVDMGQTVFSFYKISYRFTPNVFIQEAFIQEPHGWTVSYQNRPVIDQWSQLEEVPFDLVLRLLEYSPHEREGILVANEVVFTNVDSPVVK